MRNFALQWTDPAGVRQSSAVGYDRPSAEGREQELIDAQCSDVRIIETKPGVLPEPAA
ncbi:hypothetical protein GCM10010321_88770 [Streptomyces chartreusis]|nr:hypothetical protein GCM10010321_88770 [Streptomyces chartreusis]